MTQGSNASGADILLSFFSLIEDGLVNVISQLGSKNYQNTNETSSDFVDHYPRNIVGYSETVDLFVSYGKKSSEVSVNFLISILPNAYTADGFNSDLYARILDRARNGNPEQQCSQNLIDLLLILFFADCSAQILSYHPNLSICKKLIQIGNLVLDARADDDVEESIKNLIIRQFSVIFSFLSINNPSDLIDNFENLVKTSSKESHHVLILHRFIRLNTSKNLTVEKIGDFLNSLLDMKINNEWAEGMIPLVMQVSSDLIEQFQKFLNDLCSKIKSDVLSGAPSNSNANGKNKKPEPTPAEDEDVANTQQTKNKKNHLMNLFAIAIQRDEQLKTTYYQSFLDTIVEKCADQKLVLGCLEAFLSYLRGKFVSKANLFWEWGKQNGMSHPGIEATHINQPDMDLSQPGSFADTFNKMMRKGKEYIWIHHEVDSDILINFAARDFSYFMKFVLPSFIVELGKNRSFRAVNLCLNKIVDARLRFSEWAQENQLNQGHNIGQTIPELFLQLKPTLFYLAQNYDLKTLSNYAFSFHLVDNNDYPVLSLPIAQERIAPELKDRIRKQYTHQMYIRHLVLEAGEVNTDSYNIDTQAKPIAAIENSESDDEENADNEANENASQPENDAEEQNQDDVENPEEKKLDDQQLYDVKIRPRRTTTLNESEETYIQILSFFPRIMNKSDFNSKIGEQLFNSMVSDCPAVALYSIMVVNQLFNAKPEDRLLIFDALMKKILKTKLPEHLFVFMLFFIKLLDLSFTPKCNDDSEIFNFIQRTEALCVFLMALKSNVITTLCEALSERVYKFANGMRMQSCLYSLTVNYQEEISRAVASKLKTKLLLFNSKTSRNSTKRQYQLSSPVLFTTNLIEILNLMNLKAPVEFFEYLNELIFDQLRETQYSRAAILLPFLVRYASEDQINNIKNFLSSNNILNKNAQKFKKNQIPKDRDDVEEEDTKEQAELKIASYSEYYPISIFSASYSDQRSMDLQTNYGSKYLITNAKDLRSLHWTTVIYLLCDLYDQLDQLNEEAITNHEMDDYVQIFNNAMKATDVKFAIFADQKVRMSILKLINIYIKHYSITSEGGETAETAETDKIKKLKITSNSALVKSFPNFCFIISRFFNSFIIDNNACSEGPFRRPIHSEIVNDSIFQPPTINNLFEYLIYFTNTGLYKYARHALCSILCVFPILDNNEEYMKGKIIRIQIDYPIEDEVKIYKRIKRDLLSIILQTGNERFVLNKINRQRMNVPIYSALCANDDSLLPLYIEDVFRCPLLFESMYKYFVGTDTKESDIGSSEVQFNQKIIQKYAGRLLIIALFFMMSKKCQIRIKAYNLLKRFAPLFYTVLYQDDKKNGRMMFRIQKLEASFMSFSSDSECPTVPLLIKYAQIIASSFTELIDDIVDSLVDCLCTVGINNGINNVNSLYNYCTYYDYQYYANNDDFLLNKSEIQSNVLQILSMFLRNYTLDEPKGRFTPYILVKTLLPIYNHLESNSMTHYYALFDQLCDNSQQKVDFVVEVALHCPKQVDPSAEYDYSPFAAYAVIVHFSASWGKMIIETLCRHLTFSYWYVGAVEKSIKDEKYSVNIDQFYSYYYPVVQALHIILRNSSFQSSSSDKEKSSPFSYLKPYLYYVINFCLIFFNGLTEGLLYDILTKLELPEALISLLRKKGENSINMNETKQYEHESDSESDDENEVDFEKEFNAEENAEDQICISKGSSKPFTSRNTLFRTLPENLVSFLCDRMKEIKEYGREFLNNLGEECLRWCCGCGDLKIAGRACVVFSEILRPFSPDVIGKILQSMSFALKSSYLYINKTTVVQEYITGIISIFNASIDKFKKDEKFYKTFKMFYSICAQFISIPYFTMDINKDPKALKNKANNDGSSHRNIVQDECSVTLNAINTSIELCNAVNSVISKFFFYNAVNLKSSNRELVKILPGLASQCATLRPRETLDAIFLALFSTDRTHPNELDTATDDENTRQKIAELKENTSLLCTISFILFLPWLHSAFAAYHNVEPYSSLFTDDQIPLILQIGYYMGMNDQLPDDLTKYLSTTMKEPSNASVEDFVLQAGICIARDKPKAFIAAAPLLIEMAKLVSARIIKLNRNKKGGSETEPPDFVSTSFFGGVVEDGIDILLNENNNIAFLLAIVVVVRSFLEYSKISNAIFAISPLIAIVSSALDSYQKDKELVGLINVNSVAENCAIENLKVELAKLVGAFLSSSNIQKDEDELPFKFEADLCQNSWSDVTESIITILKDNSIDSIDIAPEFKDIVSAGGAHTDLSELLILVPVDPYLWTTKRVKALRDKMKLVRVKGYSSKQSGIEKAIASKPDKTAQLKANVPAKFSIYQQYKTKMAPS